ASENAGFQPWDAPILEHLDLYRAKSGPEIVKQLYTLTDQGGRELAIRPEMTPSLARMVSARAAALPRPVKWYCIARMCRYEAGQRGRLREFWQWNCDVLDVTGPPADAEVIGVALDALEARGLTADDVEVRVNSRSLMAALLNAAGVPPDRHADVYAVADKRGKVEPEKLKEMFEALGLGPTVLNSVLELLESASLDQLEETGRRLGLTGFEEEVALLRQLFDLLDALDKNAYYRFDPGVVRGLAYYTGPVFEMFDRSANLRALCGGGRYDRLLEALGGASMPACGFGMGDVVLTELLKDLGRLPTAPAAVVCHVIPFDAERLVDAARIARRLRRRGVSADYAMKPAALGKALKRASAAGVPYVVLVGGDEWTAGRLRIKDLRRGEERDVLLDEIDAHPFPK
ncbi:MAG: histidine--tRNA ligase, partial [Planctomycetia bacterium]